MPRVSSQASRSSLSLSILLFSFVSARICLCPDLGSRSFWIYIYIYFRSTGFCGVRGTMSVHGWTAEKGWREARDRERRQDLWSKSKTNETSRYELNG